MIVVVTVTAIAADLPALPVTVIVHVPAATGVTAIELPDTAADATVAPPAVQPEAEKVPDPLA